MNFFPSIVVLVLVTLIIQDRAYANDGGTGEPSEGPGPAEDPAETPNIHEPPIKVKTVASSHSPAGQEGLVTVLTTGKNGADSMKTHQFLADYKEINDGTNRIVSSTSSNSRQGLMKTTFTRTPLPKGGYSQMVTMERNNLGNAPQGKHTNYVVYDARDSNKITSNTEAEIENGDSTIARSSETTFHAGGKKEHMEDFSKKNDKGHKVTTTKFVDHESGKPTLKVTEDKIKRKSL